jgi:hypothetical protein
METRTHQTVAAAHYSTDWQILWRWKKIITILDVCVVER